MVVFIENENDEPIESVFHQNIKSSLSMKNAIVITFKRRVGMDYKQYLPDIDVEDGKTRVMNNLALYCRLVGKFDGLKMAEDIKNAVLSGDDTRISHAAHALKGTAANLGFPIVLKITAEIEVMAKAGQNCEHLMPALTDAAEALAAAAQKFLAAQK
ncbi:MAG: Hpt domain-containing protein [Defluviitaleaceae bacterium]|nr:Hpt domain-containing protein [Defluviitaleaceae bacterium]